MAREDNIKVEGTVVKVHSGGMYQVETDDGRSIRTKTFRKDVPLSN